MNNILILQATYEPLTKKSKISNEKKKKEKRKL